jgi:hypothetical protein
MKKPRRGEVFLVLLKNDQAKLASTKDQFTRLFRKVSTNFGRRLR